MVVGLVMAFADGGIDKIDDAVDNGGVDEDAMFDEAASGRAKVDTTGSAERSGVPLAPLLP